MAGLLRVANRGGGAGDGACNRGARASRCPRDPQPDHRPVRRLAPDPVGDAGRRRRHRPRIRDHAGLDVSACRQRSVDDGRCRRVSGAVPGARCRRRHHRARRCNPADPVRPGRPGRSRLSGGPRRRSERGRRAGRPQRGAARRRELRGDARASDRTGPGSPRRDGRPRAVGGTAVGTGSTTSGASGCTRSSACSPSAARWSPTSIGRGSWPRSSTPSPSCLAAEVVALFSRQARRGIPARGGQGLPAWSRSGSSCPAARTGSSPRDRDARAGWKDSMKSRAWPPEYLAERPGGDAPACGDGPPDRGGRRRWRRCCSSPASARSALFRARVRHRRSPDRPGRDRPPERRPARPRGRLRPARSVDRAAQPTVLRRGGRDRIRQCPASGQRS